MSRIQVAKTYSLPIFADGTAFYAIEDTQTGETIALHRFRAAEGPNAETYYQAQRRVAHSIAEALDAAGDLMLDEIKAETDRVASAFQFAPFPPAGHRAV